MKKIFNSILKMGVCAVLLTFAAGCAMEQLEINGLPEGIGLVQFNVNGSDGARTSFPALTGVTYKITATPKPTGENVEFATLSKEIAAGSYDFSIEAQVGTPRVTVASASLSNVTVADRQTTTVPVLLVPVTGGADGTLSWDIDAPDESLLDTATLEYITSANFAANTAWVSLTPFDGGTQALAAGSYVLRTFVEGDAGYTLGDMEAFHIYSGLTTEVNFHYPGELLFPPKDALVEVTFNATTATITGVTVALGGDVMDTHEHVMVKDTTNANKWTLKTQVPNVNSKFNGTLFVSTASNAAPIQIAFSNIDCEANDSTAAVLVPGGVTINTITVSITGTGGSLTAQDGAALSAGGVSLVNGGKLDVLNGAQLALDPIEPIKDWRLASLKVGGADFNPEQLATITADTTIALVFEYEAGYTSPVLFAWSQATQPWTFLAQGEAVIGKVTNFPEVGLAAYGTHPVIDAVNFPLVAGIYPASHFLGAPTPQDLGNGIRLNNVRFSIGQRLGNSNGGLGASNDTFLNDRGGQFDLSSRPFKVTIGYTNAPASGWWRFNLRQVTTGQIGVDGDVSRWFGEHNPTAAGFPTTPVNVRTGITYNYNAGSNATSGTFVLNIDPIEAYQGAPDYHMLEKASFVIAAQNNSGFTITNIRIEYTGAAPTAMTSAVIYNSDGVKVSGSSDPVRIIERDDAHDIFLVAKKIPAAAEGEFTWSAVGDSNITVDQNGKVHITEGVGESTITVKSGSIEASVGIEVYSVNPKSINITGENVMAGTPKTLSINLMGLSHRDVNLGIGFVPTGTTGDITWSSSDSAESYLEIDIHGKITAKAITSTPVTITAKLDGTAIEDTLLVTIVNDVSVPSNVIWRWSFEKDGGYRDAGGEEIVGTIAVDTSGTLKGETGTGLANPGQMPVIIRGAAISNEAEGILIDASGTTAPTSTTKRFIIGSDSTTASNSSSAPAGVFNFASQFTASKKVRITVNCEILTFAVGSRSLGILINNNTSAGADTPMGTNPSRAFWWASPESGSTPGVGTYTATSIATTDMTASFFTQAGSDAYLDKVFFNIMLLGYSNPNSGCKILVKGITVETVD